VFEIAERKQRQGVDTGLEKKLGVRKKFLGF